MLNHALQQTDWIGPELKKDNWRTIVHQHLQTLNWEKAQGDVHPFLEPGYDAQLLTLENLERLLVGSTGEMER